MKLLWYNSRFYDPSLSRWTQPDVIIPDPNYSQAYDRYAYVYNSPVKYNDPSGHIVPNPGFCPTGCTFWDFSNYQRVVRTLIVGALSIANIATNGATETDFQNSTWGIASYEDRFVASLIPPTFGGVTLSDDAARLGVSGYRNFVGHPASKGKKFSDWFKSNILKDPSAKGKWAEGGKLRFDIFDSENRTIFELKNYSERSNLGQRFIDQAMKYNDWATKNNYTLKYVFGEKIEKFTPFIKRLIEEGIEVYYIDDAGEMLPWYID
jgi:hypothetical protein